MTSERECGRAGDHASTRSETRNSEAAGCCCGVLLSCRVESSWVGLVPDPGRFDATSAGSLNGGDGGLGRGA